MLFTKKQIFLPSHRSAYACTAVTTLAFFGFLSCGEFTVCGNFDNCRHLCLDDFLKQLLIRFGIDSSQYSGHSFRIGAATSAARQGVPDHLIQSLGTVKIP
ncbi:uncharacterized protein LOC126824338 [Patella vulgata]|uniref:uncharacterized protein LOC126824338 n=1 Tax=Patella vulgata TaxID=6465 RepID=UPI0024A9DFBC|nr:uncharacterized protein LOC126824338 [Patella vulgata]